MKTIYLFSGFGADRRVFQNLDLSGFQPVYVDWLTPRPLESLESYIFRLAAYYRIPKQGALVLGLSFGGLCISELAKYYDFEKIVLISAVKNKFEIPTVFKLAKLFSVYKLLPTGSSGLLAKKALEWAFGLKSDAEKKLFEAIIQDTDSTFFDWAVDKIIHWDNTQNPVNCLQIHGDKDRIFPISHVDCDIRIKDAGHFMIYNRAKELSFPIRNFLL